MASKTPKFIKDYPVKIYKCGLKAGDSVRLKKILRVSGQGRSDTSIHGAGEVWEVCRGMPGIVWLRQSNGEMHTWDDDKSIFENFELIRTASREVTAKRKTVTKKKRNQESVKGSDEA